MADTGANRRGILALSAGMAAFAINDALIKKIALQEPAGQVIFIRGLFTLAILGLMLAIMRQGGTLSRAVNARVMLRSGFDAMSTVFFVAALIHMKMAELVAILLSAPLLMTAMAVVFLRERVGWRRWSAVLVGLAGTLFIVKPAPGAFDLWALAGLAAAFGSASRDLMTSRLDLAIPALTVSFAGALAVTASGLAVGANESWALPGMLSLALIATASLFIACGTYLLVIAFRGVDISVVAPFRYTLLLWAGIAGFIAFGELPDGWALVGAVMIVGSGLYTLYREARLRRAALPPP